MFGNDAAFVNGNMFFGIYGSAVLVRLPAGRAKDLLKEEEARPFEPIPGRRMNGYVVVPGRWRSEQRQLQKWVGIALEWGSTLPPKKAKG